MPACLSRRAPRLRHRLNGRASLGPELKNASDNTTPNTTYRDAVLACRIGDKLGDVAHELDTVPHDLLRVVLNEHDAVSEGGLEPPRPCGH